MVLLRKKNQETVFPRLLHKSANILAANHFVQSSAAEMGRDVSDEGAHGVPAIPDNSCHCAPQCWNRTPLLISKRKKTNKHQNFIFM